jgi:hypothetical protein
MAGELKMATSVMRPRISRKEAAYLVQVLESQVAEMEERLEQVTQLERDFAKILYDLKYPVQVLHDDKGYFAGHRIVGTEETLQLVRLASALKEEHSNLLTEKFWLWNYLSTHKRLLEKYRAIAEGNTRRGDYKHFNSYLNFPREETALKVLK